MKNALSILKANRLYLLTMLLILIIGSLIQFYSLGWGLVGTEILLILLPAYIYLRRNKVNVRKSLRLRWPGWPVALLSLLMGLSIWFVDAFIDIGLAKILPFSSSLGTDPQSLLSPIQTLGLFLGMAVLAPICEEFLFRGTLQPAFESKGPVFSILFGAALFAFYHMRLQGLPALLPVALLLSFALWRSKSLIVTILIHFGNNLLGVLYTITLLHQTSWQFPGHTLWTALAGLLVGGAVFLLFLRLTRGISEDDEEIPETVEEDLELIANPSSRKTNWLKTWWPLLIAGLLYIILAGLEVVVGLSAAGQPLSLSAPEGWNETHTFTYEVLNPADEVVGKSICTLSPEAEDYLLDCEADVEGFEVTQGKSYWSSIAFQRTMSSRWDKDTLNLKTFEMSSTNEMGTLESKMTVNEDNWEVSVYDEYSNQTHVMEGSGDALMIHQLPWQLMGINLQAGQNYKANVVWDLRYNEKSGQSEPGQESMFIRIGETEVVETEAGSYVCHPVSIGSGIKAWYAANETNTLVKWSDQTYTYILTAEEIGK